MLSEFGVETTKRIFLVGGFNTLKKYESQLGLLFPVYGKINFMFQTTNQLDSPLHMFFLVLVAEIIYSNEF